MKPSTDSKEQSCNIPTLLTDRLILRPNKVSDLDELTVILSDRDTIRYFPRTEPWPREIVMKWIDDHWNHWRKYGYGWWAVEHREDKKLLGWCGLNILDETGETEVLYLLRKSYWGQGLATEAAKESLDYGIRKQHLKEIIGLVHPENLASQRVLEKIGLSYVNRIHLWGMDLLRYRITLKQNGTADRVNKY